MRSLFHAATALFTAAALLSAAPVGAVTGSGRTATESRAAADFEAIAADGPIDIVVRQGAKEGVTVQADDNLLPLVETVVETGSSGRTLTIRLRRGENITFHKTIKVTVDVVRLTSVSTHGSGDVSIDALKTPSFKLSLSGSSDADMRSIDTDAFDIRIAGSGDIRAAGSAKTLQLSIAGSGDAELARLTADDVSVSIAGSGDASVTANKSLSVSVAGSGDVSYGGAVASVKTSLAGSGSVSRR